MVNAENCACLFIGQRFFAGISNERIIIGIGNRDDDFFRRKEETDFFKKLSREVEKLYREEIILFLELLELLKSVEFS